MQLECHYAFVANMDDGLLLKSWRHLIINVEQE